MRTRVRVALALALLASAVGAGAASGQILSPGKLSKAHAELEGIRNCTRCHELRRQGVSRERCLSCHEPLAARIAEDRGFHSALAEEDCAVCHKEHLGPDFAMVRLDTTAFDHALTGYELEGGHRDVECRTCHHRELVRDEGVLGYAAEHGTLEHTFLGLSPECATCHEPDTPHEDQFAARACADCHDTQGWGDAPGFDHGQSRYALTGAHLRVECSSCHTPAGGDDGGAVRYRPLAFSGCADCHDDEHGGAMPGACARCHATTAWRDVNRRRIEAEFDHEPTGFSLLGRHAEALCASCHDAGVAAGLTGIALRFQSGTEGRAFPSPERDACMSCHVDRHDGQLERASSGSDCAGCHGQTTWLPADYDVARHNRESGYVVEGAHVVVPCLSCHEPVEGMPRFRLGSPTCADCHGAEEDPHAGQFPGRACESCHASDAFTIPEFDHDQTRYALDGAHRDVPCAECHRAESDASGRSFIRYRPLGRECEDCHGETR